MREVRAKAEKAGQDKLANALTPDINEALVWAAEWGEVKCLRRLIDAGADINCALQDGTTQLTPIQMAAKSGHPQVVQALISAGANVNDFDLEGRSALMLVAKSGKPGALSTISSLIAAGAYVNQLDISRTTALMWATLRLSANCVSALVKAGADVNFRNSDGCSALLVAALTFSLGKVKILVDAGAGGDSCLTSQGTSLVKELCAASGLVDFCMPGTSLQLLACLPPSSTDTPEIAQCLIDAGADVNGPNTLINALDTRGETLLTLAIDARRNYKLAPTLIENGADVNQGNKHLLKPLVAATRLSRYSVNKGLKEFARTLITQLLAAGADVNAGATQTPA